MWVKICGITNEEDALLAAALGADAVGFVFAPSSRQIPPVLAYDIVRRLPPEILSIGVFRNESVKRVVEICHRIGLRGAQLHGHETVEDTRWVSARVPVVIKAFPAGDPALDIVDDYGADAVLIDSPMPGSGQVFDWSLAEGAPTNRRVILAGGLNAQNVGDAITRVQPWGVDVSSGVEDAPGRKDPVRLRAFIAAARDAEPGAYHSSRPGPFDWAQEH
ncbi:MAG: phosphoribosylanthranilate isomerase [Acidimicrobiia bacterium]|jgi:phosphoribosylanthranilate isomerase|nr:phosphoribosylanthranilate isomerase [Acidimicrobiia bacterium]